MTKNPKHAFNLKAFALSSGEVAQVSPACCVGVPALAETVRRGDSVSLVSGEVLLNATDAILPGNHPFRWERVYRSGHTRNIGLGCGWTYRGCDKLRPSFNYVDWFDDEGRAIRFVRPVERQTAVYEPEGLQLVFESARSFILNKPGVWSRVFRRVGWTSIWRLEELKFSDEDDPFLLVYGEDELLHRIEAPNGDALELIRNGLTIERVDRIGGGERETVVRYRLDEQQHLIEANDADGRGERYAYDEKRLIQRQLVQGGIHRFDWQDARCVRQTSDDTETFRFEFNEDRKAIVQDGRGHQTSFIFDVYGRLIEQKNPLGDVSVKDHLPGDWLPGYPPAFQDTLWNRWNTSSLHYQLRHLGGNIKTDSFGRIAVRLLNDQRFHYRYDAAGNLSSVVGEKGAVARWKYDANNRLIEETDFADQKTSYRYAENGLLIERMQADIKTVYTYDDQHRLRDEQRENRSDKSLLARYRFNAEGRLREAYNRQSYIAFIYDICGRVRSEKYGPRSEDGTCLRRRIGEVLSEYNKAGILTMAELPGGETLHYQYGSDGNMIGISLNGHYKEATAPTSEATDWPNSLWASCPKEKIKRDPVGRVREIWSDKTVKLLVWMRSNVVQVRTCSIARYALEEKRARLTDSSANGLILQHVNRLLDSSLLQTKTSEGSDISPERERPNIRTFFYRPQDPQPFASVSNDSC